MGQLLIKATK